MVWFSIIILVWFLIIIYIRYVLTIAIAELESVRVPVRLRSIYASKIAMLKSKLAGKAIVQTDTIKIRMSDPLIIKQLKELAIAILNNKVNQRLAWRMDYATFFERYVQYLLGEVVKKKGATSINNPKYSISYYNKPYWAPAYLEPDLILQKGEVQYVVDAKYKSHIFNWNEISDELKDTFRHDLHQILAYCSFNRMTTKNAILVYPFSDFSVHKITGSSHLTNSDANVYLVGIPMQKDRIEDLKKDLSELLVM